MNYRDASAKSSLSFHHAHLVILRDQPVQTLLDDMVAVQILDQADNVQTQSQDDRPDLFGPSRVGQEINHLLDGSCAVHVERDADEVVGDGFADDVSLLIGRVLEKLLAEVVAEGVYRDVSKEADRRPRHVPVMSSGKCP